MDKGLQRFGIKRMKYSWLVGLSAVTILAAGCGGGSSATSGSQGSQPAATSSSGATSSAKTSPSAGTGKTYRMVVANETCHDTQEKDFKLFMTTVEKLSNGQIQGSFHSCSALGNVREVFKGLQNNSIQVGGNPTVFMSAFVPQAGVINMPWMFNTSLPIQQAIQKEATVLEKGQFRQKLAKLVAAKGFHLVSLYGLSPEIMFSRKPITKVSDFKGLKMNVGAGKEHSLMAKEWGALPVTIPIAQWYTSLQQGSMDVQEAPPDVALKLKIEQVAPYVAVTKEAMMSTILLVSKKWYDSLPANLQKVIDQAGAQQDKIGTQNLMKNEADALQQLKNDKNVHVYTFTAQQQAALKKLNQPDWATISKEPVVGPALKMLQSDVQKYGQ